LKEKDIYVACAKCFEYHSDAIHTASEEYNIPFLSRSDAYNGVNYDEELRDKGYIQSDGYTPSDLSARVLTKLLAQMGYEPVPLP
jgi:hypothetical protein